MARMSGPLSRENVIKSLENKHRACGIITENLCHYMENIRQHREGNNRRDLLI
jgi:hypothetical protein